MWLYSLDIFFNLLSYIVYYITYLPLFTNKLWLKVREITMFSFQDLTKQPTSKQEFSINMLYNVTTSTFSILC